MTLITRVLAATLIGTNLLSAQTPDDHGVLSSYTPIAPKSQEEQLPASSDHAGDKLPSLRTPIHTAPTDLGRQYGIWAAGDDYKASFHDGMTFVPYLGADYPMTQSLRWQTVSAKVGETELVENMTAKPVQSDWRYEYRFGSFTEAYDVRGEGLEQTFVLRTRPAAGDLVIRGSVTSGLHADNCSSSHQALVFFDDDQRAIINYGSAVAFDANGDRVLVGTAYEGGTITLTVPAAWMEHAVLPITVDPLLSRAVTGLGGFNPYGQVESVDIGRDDQAQTNNILITYTRAVSATDSDLWVRLGSDDFAGQSINLIFSDITNNWVTDQTSCAFVGGASRWAIVFRRFFPNSQTSQLRCHVHDSGDLTQQSNVAGFAPPAGSNDWRPDTGGVQAFASGNQALVVFQREDNSATSGNFATTGSSEVYGCLLDATTPNGAFGTRFVIKPSSFHDNERPSVNQLAEGGSSFSWVCVFQRFITGVTNEDWDLHGARIAQDGTVAPGTWSSSLANVTPKQHQLGPIVEGASGRYAVVFSTVDVASTNFKTALITGKQLHVERFDWVDGATIPSGNQPNVTLRNSIDRRWEAGGIGYDTNTESHWACAYRSTGPGTGSLYYARVGYNGEPTEGGILASGTGWVGLGGACVFDDDSNDFLYAYALSIGASNTVFGHTLTYEMVSPPSTFGVSCSNASLDWTGSQQIGSEFGRVSVSGAPPLAVHIMLAATTTANVPVTHPIVFPGCRLFVMAAGPGYLGAFPTAIGANADWQLPLPGFLDSQSLYFQDWYLDANGLIYSSERLTVPIVK